MRKRYKLLHCIMNFGKENSSLKILLLSDHSENFLIFYIDYNHCYSSYSYYIYFKSLYELKFDFPISSKLKIGLPINSKLKFNTVALILKS